MRSSWDGHLLGSVYILSVTFKLLRKNCKPLFPHFRQWRHLAPKTGFMEDNGFLKVAQLIKNCLQCGRPGFHPWVGKIPWRREWLPTPIFWPGEFNGLYGPWGLKESDMTERLSLNLREGLGMVLGL